MKTLAHLTRIGSRRRSALGSAPGQLTRIGRDERGAVAVEWSLVALTLGMLMLGAFNFGTSALHKMQMVNAVRAGLQYAVVRKPIQGDTSQISDTVLKAAPPDLTDTRQLTITELCQCPDGSSVKCDGSCATGDTRTFISIRMNEKYDTLVNFPFTPHRLEFTSEGMVRLN